MAHEHHRYHAKSLRNDLYFCPRYGLNQQANTLIPACIERQGKKEGWASVAASPSGSYLVSSTAIRPRTCFCCEEEPGWISCQTDILPSSIISGNRKTLTNQGVLPSTNMPPLQVPENRCSPMANGKTALTGRQFSRYQKTTPPTTVDGVVRTKRRPYIAVIFPPATLADKRRWQEKRIK